MIIPPLILYNFIYFCIKKYNIIIQFYGIGGLPVWLSYQAHFIYKYMKNNSYIFVLYLFACALDTF